MIYFSDDIKALAPALAAAQAAMGSAQLDSKNGHFRSRYASLASCLHAALAPLSANKLSLLQHPGYDPSTQIVSVTTCILHESGQWMKSTCSLPLGGKKDGHALKSATTYLRRIGIVSILGLPEEDDDGNATSAVSTPRVAPKSEKVKPGDVEFYRKQCNEYGVDPKIVAAFMQDHGRAPADTLTAAQLHSRLEWVKRNTGVVLRWGEEQ